MKYIYPAVFEKEGAFYTVVFPDLDGCYTQGDTLKEAVENASDILCLTLYNCEESKTPIPTPSDICSVHTENDRQFASLVSCDTLEYRKFYDSKAVKKTLTLPAWLNTMSESEGINFSAVLQDALKERLHITDR